MISAPPMRLPRPAGPMMPGMGRPPFPPHGANFRNVPPPMQPRFAPPRPGKATDFSHGRNRVRKFRICGMSFSQTRPEVFCYFEYEGHSKIIDIVPWRFGQWTKKKILLIAKWRWKTELVEKEQVGQLCPSTETGMVQDWAMVGSWCQLYSFN